MTVDLPSCSRLHISRENSLYINTKNPLDLSLEKRKKRMHSNVFYNILKVFLFYKLIYKYSNNPKEDFKVNDVQSNEKNQVSLS